MQKLKLAALFCLLSLISISGFSQNATMIHAGEIAFQKRVNAYAILDEYYVNNKMAGRDQFAKNYKATNPQFGVTNFTLLFNGDVALYAPDTQTPNVPTISLMQMLKVVYSNFKTNTFATKKTLFDDEYLISDSTKKIQWKITDETKEIAGYSCRRADVIIMDSVYVVAFYTDQIVPRGGPESFRGLPGMILEVALPHEHMTWLATRVTPRPVPVAQIQPPTGGKKINYRTLLQMLLDAPGLKSDKKTQGLFVKNFLL